MMPGREPLTLDRNVALAYPHLAETVRLANEFNAMIPTWHWIKLNRKHQAWKRAKARHEAQIATEVDAPVPYVDYNNPNAWQRILDDIHRDQALRGKDKT